MSLAVTGEPIVGPSILALFRRVFGAVGWSARIGEAVPILRWISDPPYIALVVQRHSDQKAFRVLAQGQAIRYATRCASSAWQFTQEYRSFNWQGLRYADPAALRTYYHSNALRRERMPAIHAGD
jgi:hypothetical protein